MLENKLEENIKHVRKGHTQKLTMKLNKGLQRGKSKLLLPWFWALLSNEIFT